MSPQFSEAVKHLIAKARIVSFSTWIAEYPADVIARFQAADDDRRYLTDEDLQQIKQQIKQQIEQQIEQQMAVNSASDRTELIAIAQQLRDQVTEIVDEARSQVLATFPSITQPGGGLYPSERADACWRDFWHFLRCITYGIAGQRSRYTSPDGLAAMRSLYQELQVPLDAMVVGLEGIKAASLRRVEESQRDRLSPYFDHLITQLNAWR